MLITSRRRLTALEDAAVVSLDVLPPDEAAALLARLAARPGLSARDAAVGEITGLCGHLPLAIGMLASQLRHHPAWTAVSLAAELADTRDRLAVMHTENLSVGAAFGLSYQDLPDDQQRLFRRLGLIPGPDFDAYAAAALDATSLATARRHLDELYEQHLLAEPAPGRYQLHDLLREHARALAAAGNPAESEQAAARLLDYYLHTALAAGRHFGSWVSTSRRPPPGRLPAHAPDVSALGPAAAWLEAERANLHAAADYAAGQARALYAIAIPAAIGQFLAARGHWDQFAALHQTALAAARQAGDQLGEAYTLAELGLLRREAGDYPAAAASLARAVALCGEAGDLSGQGYVLTQLGSVHVADRRLPGRRRQPPPGPGAGPQRRRPFCRERSPLQPGHAAAADRRLPGRRRQPPAGPGAGPRRGDLLGQAWSLNGLGVVQQETGDYPAAAASQRQALALFCDLGDLYGQAGALNDLGVVQQETGDYPAAAASHQQALALFRDLGSPLGQAETLNRLGELSARTSATSQACERHTQALAIARDISVPLEEARALEGIGQCHIQNDDPGNGAAYLRQALAIYQRIGAPHARRLQEILAQRG